MTEKVVHGADPWGWERVPRSELVALACGSPHDCDVPNCPGPVNKRKLEAFDELLAALEASFHGLDAMLTTPMRGNAADKAIGIAKAAREQARAAIAKAEGR